MCHPLIMDYVKQESRGKGAALQNLGNLVGEAFAIAVLFGISKKEGRSQNEAFAIAAAIVAALSLPVFCLVRDPKLLKGKSEVKDESPVSLNEL